MVLPIPRFANPTRTYQNKPKYFMRRTLRGVNIPELTPRFGFYVQVDFILLCCIQSHVTLRNPMDCSLPGSSVHGASPDKHTRVDCHALLQGIFLIQGLNPDLPHCRWILYCVNQQGSPRIPEWAAHPFSRGIFLAKKSNPALLHRRQVLYKFSSLNYQGSPDFILGFCISSLFG